MSESYASNPALAMALRRGRLSDQLLADSLKPRPVGGHAGGLAQMGTALIGGIMSGLEDRRIDRLLREDKETADAQIAALYGRGPAPAAPSGPAPVTPGSLPPPIPNPEMTGQPAPAGGTAMPVAAPAQPPAQMPEPPAPRMVRLANGQEINLDVLQNAEASPNQRVRLAAASVRRSIDDDRAERRYQEQIALQRDAAGRATAAAGRESFGQPTEMIDANGQRVMVQVGNRGTIRPVQGYSAPPAAPAREIAASFTPANAAAMLADMAAAYEAGTLTPEQANRYEIAASMMQRPQTYLDQQSGQMVTVPAMTFPEPIQRALAAGQLRRARGGATVPAAAPGLPAPDMAAPAPMAQNPRAGMAPPVMPQNNFEDNLAGLEDYYRGLNAPAPAAPITPPAAPGVMPRAGDATAMPPMVGEQGRIPLATGGNMTRTQVWPERGPPVSPDPSGQQSVIGPSGERVLADIPGGPAARQREREEKAETEKKNQRLQAGGIVLQNIERIFDRAQNTRQPIAGFFGPMATRIPGSAASDVQELINTMKSEIAFGRLQQMREASPTGAALGAVTENELKLLQSTIGSLEQRQGTPQFIDELKRIGNMYLDVVHGRNNGPPRYTTSYDQRGAAPTPPPGFQVVR